MDKQNLNSKNSKYKQAKSVLPLPELSEHSSQERIGKRKDSTKLNGSSRWFNEDLIESMQQNFEMDIQDQSMVTTLRTEIYTSEDEKEMIDCQEFLFGYKLLLPPG